jgi:hypothetical protein
MQTQADRTREQDGVRAAVPGFGPDPPGQRARELLGVATTMLVVCRFPDAPISPALDPHALGSPVWR